MIIDVIDQNLPWNDSLQTHFTYFAWWGTYPISQSAYNSIEGWGIHNISSEFIRSQIVSIYQDKVDWLKSMENDERQVQLGTGFGNLIATEIDWTNIEQVRPYDYAKFLKNTEFSARLKNLKAITTLSYNNRKTILKAIQQVQSNLNEEINRLERGK